MTAVEHAHEALEASQARLSGASIRGDLVKIGRGNLLSGRQQSGGRKEK